ncbi:unnamed protein product [Polarella glacialis]|uniref:Uncharacterized protein n=1 Tax=Polarella glacialis TaxID=89957 RepID=A0A813GIX9_POLGL|nr:unnamed protein product [Polarella glacialis]
MPEAFRVRTDKLRAMFGRAGRALPATFGVRTHRLRRTFCRAGQLLRLSLLLFLSLLLLLFLLFFFLRGLLVSKTSEEAFDVCYRRWVLRLLFRDIENIRTEFSYQKSSLSQQKTLNTADSFVFGVFAATGMCLFTPTIGHIAKHTSQPRHTSNSPLDYI